MLRWPGMVLVGACVSTSAPDDGKSAAEITARDIIAASVRDPAKLEALLKGGAVTLGGIAFADATCATSFAASGEIGAAQVPAFAACLVGLHLDVSPRRSTFADVVVLRYAPGFELEVRLVGGRISWIGASARRAGEGDIPTITHDTLEQLRLAGTRTADLGADGAAWFKVCLDETGAVAKAELYETTSLAAAAAARSAFAGWKFRPFVQPRPVCAMVRVASTASVVETLPAAPPIAKSGKPAIVFSLGATEPKRISGVIAVAPDDLTKLDITRRGVREVRGQFRVCVDETGTVESVFPLAVTGFPDYDHKLTTLMREWRYAPFAVEGEPQPFCTTVEFRYKQR